MKPAFRALTGIWIAGLSLRLLAASTSIGFDFPNEPARFLEPLAHLLGFPANLPFEWTEGLLSWLPIHVGKFVLSFFEIIGVTDPISQILFLKCLIAFFTSLVIPATAIALWTIPAPQGVGLIGAAIVAILPEQILRSVRLMDYSMEMGALSLVLIVLSLWKKKRLPIILIGTLLGMLFFVRFQSGLYWLGSMVFLAYALRENRSLVIRQLVLLTLSYALTIVCLATLEARLTEADFMDPFWNYIHYNLIEGKSHLHFGADPWHRYFSETAKYYGIAGILALICIPCLDRKRGIPLQASLILYIMTFAVHTLISHKEGRFLYGAQWLLVPAGLAYLREWDLRSRTPQVFLILLAIGMVVSTSRVRERWTLQARELREISGLKSKLRADPLPLVIHSGETLRPYAFLLRPPREMCFSVKPSALPCAEPLPSPAWHLEDASTGPVLVRKP